MTEVVLNIETKTCSCFIYWEVHTQAMDTVQQIRWASSGFQESYLSTKMGLSKIIRKGMPELTEPHALAWFSYTLASEV